MVACMKVKGAERIQELMGVKVRDRMERQVCRGSSLQEGGKKLEVKQK